MTLSTGTFGVASLTAVTPVKLFTNDSAFPAIMNINFMNRNTTPANVSCAISNSATYGGIADGEWYEYLHIIGALLPLERTGRVISPGQCCWVVSAASFVSVQAYGIVGRL